jgi:hypothetical protein
VNRLGHSYVIAAASGTALIAAAVVAFVMLVSLQLLHDWPASSLGLRLGGDGGSGRSGSAKQALGGARAIHAGGVGVSRAVATGAAAGATAAGVGKNRADAGTEATGAGKRAMAISPATAATPVQSPPPNSPSGGRGGSSPEGGNGPAGGGGESGGAPQQTGSTPPPSTRNVNPGPAFGACQVQGEAQFSPGLTSSSESEAFGYELNGSMEGCRSSQEGVPASGTVSVGQAIPEQVTNSITGAIDTVIYREPIPTGSGGCEGSTTEGQALETWADGTATVVSYSTTGPLTAVHLSGTAAPSMTLSAVNPAPGDPATFTIGTSRYAGESAVGLLIFQPPDPTACTTPIGATTTAVNGFVGLGSP